MEKTIGDTSIQKKPLRLWPGVVIVLLQWLARFGVPVFFPENIAFGVMGGLLGGLGIILWWAFFSRAPGSERWGAIVLMVIAMVGTSLILHVSIATGMMGMMFVVYAIPVLSLAFVAWAVISRQMAERPRRGLMVITIFLSCGVWALIRTGGFGSDLDHDFAWRWSKTAEQMLLAKEGKEPMSLPQESYTLETGTDWPGFRGPNRDGVIKGVSIETDWSASPPVEMWRRPIGPGWSSFAVHGGLFYSQEQRGEEETVSCYNITTGEPVWIHRDMARFWESNGGAGPRGTPTLSNGRIFTLGGTGILNALNAHNGSVVWSRNAASDTGAKLPVWGFSSSPLVIDDMVIVATSGALIAYDLDTGEKRWSGPVGGEGYCSPQLFTIDGIPQILQLSGEGLTSTLPDGGNLLWEHKWSGYPIVQPAQTEDGDILISVSDSSGTRRLTIANTPEGWTVKEQWTSLKLKSYFNDFVLHKGHAYGYDGRTLSCVDIEGGKRKWKKGRYGGQLVLLADQNLLLVLSERGELALIQAIADQFKELARFPAIKGKTWNHPVLVNDVLLVRNDKEMVAFRLTLKSNSPAQEPL